MEKVNEPSFWELSPYEGYCSCCGMPADQCECGEEQKEEPYESC